MSGDRLHLPTGETITVLRRGTDFELEGYLPARCPGPPAHRHRIQAEEFTVLEGVLRVRVGCERRDLREGETAVVPPGVTHGFGNPTDRPTRIRTREMPTDQLEAQLRLLAASGRVPPLLGLARLNADHDLTFTLAGLPDVVQRPLWRALAALDRRLHRR